MSPAGLPLVHAWCFDFFFSALTSCTIIGGSGCGSITRAGPFNVPVFVQDVLSCLGLSARSEQRVICEGERGKKKLEFKLNSQWWISA